MSGRFSFAERLNADFWRRVVASTGGASRTAPESLGAFRVLFALQAAILWAPWFSWLSQVPAAFYEPPVLSPMVLLAGFPPGWLLFALEGLGLLCLPFMVVGLRSAAASWIFIATGAIGFGLSCCMGKIDHEVLFFGIIAAGAYGGWGRRYALDAGSASDNASDSLRLARARALYAVVLAFGMLTAGLPKLKGWVDLDLTRSGFLAWFYPGYFALGRTRLLAPAVLGSPLWLLKLADYSAVLLELSGFIALWAGRRAWLTWLFVACTFHLGNTLALNIPFGAQSFSYLFFADISRWPALTRPLGNARVRLALGGIAAVAVVVQFSDRWAGHSTPMVGVASAATFNMLDAYITLGICGAVLTLLALELRTVGSTSPVGASTRDAVSQA